MATTYPTPQDMRVWSYIFKKKVKAMFHDISKGRIS